MESLDLSAPYVVLEDARTGRESAQLFCNPSSVISARDPAEVVPALEAAEEARRAGSCVAGYFSYELGYLLEPCLARRLWKQRDIPLLWLGVFDQCRKFEGVDAENALVPEGRAYAGPLELEWSEAEHAHRFRRLHDLIVAGDIYQANLTFRARFRFVGDARALYRDLKSKARAGHCAFVADGDRHIVSLSPELFFEVSADGGIRAKPMKGTAARGENPADDSRARAHLVASEKDRAENLMIVDLLRNDLARVAKVGSVTVENLFEVETYPTLHQLVSTIAARLKANMRVADLVAALFPCGSVTGAPKIRAMEVIRELEGSPRGVYCGAIGAFSPDGSAAFNVAIRTLTVEGARGELGIGGGIVFDSLSAGEYEECLVKARFYEAARTPLFLIETLRWSPEDGFVRGDRHLARMEKSAEAFGMTFDRATALQRMGEAVASAGGETRVRLTLSESGGLVATATPLAPVSAPSWRCAISPERVHSRDALLRHKTSRREMFDAEQARVVQAGFDEVLFLNENGMLTEGSRTNLFAEIDGRLLTPSVASGLLDGCLRSEFVEQGRCEEAALSIQDLQRAARLFVGNSLRGLVPANVTL